MTLDPRPRHTWRLRTRFVELGERTLVMGILNITPDSFSDGGRFMSVHAAEQHGLYLLEGGADILDLGAESTRPSATALSATEEQARLLPVLEAIRKARPSAVLSVDTYHASTARAAIEAGAEIVNDVSGLLWDESMPRVLTQTEQLPGMVLMHTRGTPQEWPTLPRLHPASVGPLVRNELGERLQAAVECGISRQRIILDPGFGFGKLGPENYSLLAALGTFHALDRPILVGLSRKGFLARPRLGKPSEHGSPGTQMLSPERLHATIAANTAAILAGAHVIRVHDVAAAAEAAGVADALLAAL